MNKCSKCGKGIEKEFDFCPYCGNSLDTSNNWGMLGKNDHIMAQNSLGNSFFGGGILNKMLGNAMKMLEKELQEGTKINQAMPKRKFQLFINGQKINLGGENPEESSRPKIKKKEKSIPSVIFSKENLKKFSELPREEPKTSVRRLSDRIVYDIEVPEVKSKDNISIVSLENSVEIKAIGKNKAYYKAINIDLPILDYSWSKGKLILEFGMKN